MDSASTSVCNLLALEVAALVGFFLGLLEALERMPYGPTLQLAEIGLGIAVLVGLASADRGRARIRERILVSLLRAGLSGGVFVFVFEGMRLLLKVGAVGGALASWAWADILGLLLARLAPASTPASQSGSRETPRTSTKQASPRSRDVDRSPGSRPTPRAVPHAHRTGSIAVAPPAHSSPAPSTRANATAAPVTNSAREGAAPPSAASASSHVPDNS